MAAAARAASNSSEPAATPAPMPKSPQSKRSDQTVIVRVEAPADAIASRVSGERMSLAGLLEPATEID